jgi:hypothetical protein
MAAFNARYPASDTIRNAFALCETTKAELSWPLLVFYSRLHPLTEDCGSSDGFIHSARQAWGKRLGLYRLDHFGNLGFFMQIDLRARRAARNEFERLVNDSVALMSSSVSY